MIAYGELATPPSERPGWRTAARRNTLLGSDCNHSHTETELSPQDVRRTQAPPLAEFHAGLFGTKDENVVVFMRVETRRRVSSSRFSTSVARGSPRCAESCQRARAVGGWYVVGNALERRC